jgi:hypothetical protein
MLFNFKLSTHDYGIAVLSSSQPLGPFNLPGTSCICISYARSHIPIILSKDVVDFRGPTPSAGTIVKRQKYCTLDIGIHPLAPYYFQPLQYLYSSTDMIPTPARVPSATATR